MAEKQTIGVRREENTMTMGSIIQNPSSRSRLLRKLQGMCLAREKVKQMKEQQYIILKRTFEAKSQQVLISLQK